MERRGIRIANGAAVAFQCLGALFLYFADALGFDGVAATDYGLLSMHFALSALLMIASSWREETETEDVFLPALKFLLLNAPLTAFGVITAILAGRAISGDPAEAVWLVPASLSYLVHFIYRTGFDGNEDESLRPPYAGETPDDEEEEDEEDLYWTPEDGLDVPPDAGAVVDATPLRNLGRSALYFGLYTVVGGGAAVFLFLTGGLWLEELSGLIFDGSATDFQTRWLALVEFLATDRSIWLEMVPNFLFTFFSIALAGFIAEFASKMNAARREDYNRPLTIEERQWIERGFITLHLYNETKDYPALYRLVAGMSYFSVLALMFLSVMGVSELAGLVAAMRPEAVAGEALILHEESAGFGAASIAWLAGLFVYWYAMQRVGRGLPLFGEYLFARGGWNSLTPAARTPTDWLDVMLRRVRLHLENIAEDFSPPDFIRRAFAEFEGLILRLMLGGLALTALLFGLDINRFVVVTEKEVAWSGYFQFGTTRLEAGDIAALEISCTPWGGGEDSVEPVYYYRWVVETPDGQRIIFPLVINETWLAAAGKFRQGAEAAGVPVRAAKEKGRFFGADLGYEADCLDEIAERFADTPVAGKVAALMAIAPANP